MCGAGRRDGAGGGGRLLANRTPARCMAPGVGLPQPPTHTMPYGPLLVPDAPSPTPVLPHMDAEDAARLVVRPQVRGESRKGWAAEGAVSDPREAGTRRS